MNKNEMIEWLHALRSACEDMELVRANFEDYRKPHHMIVRKLIHEVIGALEDISAEDCVSRQAVLDLAKFDGRDGLGSIIHAFDVEQLPPVTPAEKISSSEKPNKWIHHKSEARRWKRRYLDLKQRIFKLEEQTRWIPVSERYPEDGQRVLVDYCDEDAGIMLIRFNVNGYHSFKAWMPLPEPYKASPTGSEGSE